MDDFLKLLGLVYRAKKLVLGEEVLKQINKVKLLIMANDISDKSKERLEKKAHYYNIEIIDNYSSKQLSSCLGKSIVKSIGVIDDGFKQGLLKKLK